ncbi:hypothetical protein E2C01_101129 [Portunus trituberculatus]|nr:hypothetical protein [Portunus trituberculatus]
MPNVLAF